MSANEARNLVAETRDERRPFSSYEASPDSKSDSKAGDLLRSNDLQFLNEHFAKANNLGSDALQSFGGIIGKLRSAFKRKIHAVIVGVLEKHFSAEREFQGHLVRYLNDTAKYVDARDMANFWELIRKIDYDVQKSLDRIERINDEQMGAMHSQERRINEMVQNGVVDLRDKVAKHQAAITTLEGVARGLEGLMSRVAKNEAGSSTPNATESDASSAESLPDYSYLLLENRFRGSEDIIKDLLGIYPAFFEKASHPVLEIGSGRGELLELFKENSITAYGVDIDKAMVSTAVSKGLNAQFGDGIAHLRSLEDSSIGGVIAIQVVEHLTQPQLQELFQLCMSKVESGGRIIFETINPRSVLALSSNYFRNPTHVWPLHPDTLEYAMNLSGLKTVDVKFLSPVAREAQLREIPVEEYMSPRWAHAIQSINRNFEQLNSLMYGFQDYCIIAEVP